MIEHEGEGADHAQSVTNEVDLAFGGDAADVGETAAGHQVHRGFGEAAGDVLEHAVVCAVSDGCTRERGKSPGAGSSSLIVG